MRVFGRSSRRVRLRGGAEHVGDTAREVERLLRDVVVDAVEDLAAATERVGHAHRHAGATGVGLGAEERLREEPPELAGAADRQRVLVRWRSGSEARKALADAVRNLEVFSAQRGGLEESRTGCQRIHGRVDPELTERFGEADHDVDARERRKALRRPRAVLAAEEEGLYGADGAVAVALLLHHLPAGHRPTAGHEGENRDAVGSPAGATDPAFQEAC